MMATPMKDLSCLKYKEQSIWFLNGFWSSFEKGDPEKIWDYIQHFIELDKLQTPPKGADGNELDQFWSAKFLEDKDAAMPALQRKDALKNIDHDSNGKMSAIEYLTWKFHKQVPDVENAPQGSNQELVEAAQKKIDQVNQSMQELEPKLKAAQDAFAVVKAAEDEVSAAVAALKAEEVAYSQKCEELERKSKEGGVVQKNKAANELAQLKSEDPLPLRKAKITQEAALRRAEKARKAAEEPKMKLEQAYEDLEGLLKAAIEELEEAKRKGGVAFGSLWWMERELFEADHSLPKARQRYDHSKPFEFKQE